MNFDSETVVAEIPISDIINSNNKILQFTYSNIDERDFPYYNISGKKSLNLTDNLLINDKEVEIKRTHHINDEQFELEILENEFFLSHPRWSITGKGKTLIDAEREVIMEGKEVLEILSRDSLTDITSESQKFVEFLFKL